MPRYTYYKQKKFQWRFPKKKNPADASSSNPPPPPWVELPRDITANILHRLGTIEVLQTARKVCTTWRSVCQDPAMWRVIDISKDGDYPENVLDAMCRCAVDLSQGQLVDITIKSFGTDDLLVYIAQRANQLRRLRLVSCSNLSSERLSKAAIQFPSLQELEIYFSNISSEGIKTVGLSCPRLKSFTFNKYGSRAPVQFDEEALAVAENMHGLCHLALFGNKMTNKGVQAILDGCPHLESLDLRQCFNVTLEGDLGERCSRQLKDLKCPNDSTCDYEFGDYAEDDYDFESDFSDGFLDYYDYYDDFEYDDYADYADPFNHEYLELDDYPNIPLGW